MMLFFMLFALQDSAGDLEALRTRVEKNPKDVRAHLDLADALMRKGKRKEALPILDRAIELDPKNAQAYLQRGTVRMGLHDREGALADWKRAVELDPELRSRVEEFRRGGRDRRGGFHGPHVSQSPEEVKRSFREQREALLKEDPALVRRVEEALRQGRFPEAGRMLAEYGHRKERLARLKEEDPDAYRLEVRVQELDRACFTLAEKIRRAPKADGAAELRKELSQKLSELFDLREARRLREVEDLQRRLAQLQESARKRKENKARIVERRLKRLLGEPDLDEW